MEIIYEDVYPSIDQMVSYDSEYSTESVLFQSLVETKGSNVEPEWFPKIGCSRCNGSGYYKEFQCLCVLE